MPESVPNYLSSDAQGNIGALFPGGVQMIQAPSLPAAGINKIAWVTDPVTRALTAEVYGFQSASPAVASGLALSAQYGGVASTFSIEQTTAPATSSIRFGGIGGTSGYILDNALNSSFMQVRPIGKVVIGPLITIGQFSLAAGGGAFVDVDLGVPAPGYAVMGGMIDNPAASYNGACLTWGWNNVSGSVVRLSFVNPTGAGRSACQWRGFGIGYG